MIRTGEVVERNGEMAIVTFERPKACAGCNACMGNTCTRIELLTDANIGDTVDVEMPDKGILSASAMTYLIPLALLLMGLIGGTALHEPLGLPFNVNLFAAMLGFALLAVALAIVHRIDRSLARKKVFVPRLLRVRDTNSS